MAKKWLATALVVALLLTTALTSWSVSGYAVMYGDVNGDSDINMKDVLLLRKYISKMDVTIDPVAADVNGDGDINMKDVLLIRKFIAGWDVLLDGGKTVSEQPSDEPIESEESTFDPSVDPSDIEVSVQPSEEPVSEEPSEEPVSEEPSEEPASEEPSEAASEEPVSEEPSEETSEEVSDASEAPLVETVLYESTSAFSKTAKADKVGSWFKQVKQIKQDATDNGGIDPDKGEYYQVIVTGKVSSGSAYVYLGENNSWEEYHDLESVGQDLTTEEKTVTLKIRQAIYGIEGEIYVCDGGDLGHTVSGNYIKVSVFRRADHKPVVIDFDPAAYNLYPDQITATLYNADANEFGITWHTYSSEGNQVLQYVKMEGMEPDFTKATTVPATTDVYETKTMPYNLETNLFVYGNYVSVVQDYSHKAAMTGLEPSITYAYRVGDPDAGIWSEVGKLTTREAAPHDFSFIWMSDSQVGKSDDTTPYRYMRKALEGALAASPDAAFVVNGGDIVQSSKYMHLWRSQFNGLQDILMNIPLMPVTGNHDSIYDVAGDHEIIKHFNIDYPIENNVPEYGMFYSFDYSTVHFVVVNTDCFAKSKGALDETQLAWLKADLAANTQPWTIVMMHRPMFAIRQVEEQANRLQLLDLFNDYGVDLVMQAHEHVYMRSYPINYVAAPNEDPTAPQIKEAVNKNPETVNVNGFEYFKDPDGVLFVTSATCGADGKAPMDETDKSFCYTYDRGYSSSWTSVSVEGDTLTVSTNYETEDGTHSYVDGTWGIVKTLT